jgi:hypothetical protein
LKRPAVQSQKYVLAVPSALVERCSIRATGAPSSTQAALTGQETQLAASPRGRMSGRGVVSDIIVAIDSTMMQFDTRRSARVDRTAPTCRPFPTLAYRAGSETSARLRAEAAPADREFRIAARGRIPQVDDGNGRAGYSMQVLVLQVPGLHPAAICLT